MKILRAERQVGGGVENAMHRFQRRERRGQHDLDGRILVQGAGQFLHEADGLGGRLVHLPIPDNEGGAHGLLNSLVFALGQGDEAGQRFAFQQFERCAAAGGNEGNILGFTGSMDRHGRLTAADDRQGVGVGNRVSDR